MKAHLDDLDFTEHINHYPSILNMILEQDKFNTFDGRLKLSHLNACDKMNKNSATENIISVNEISHQRVIHISGKYKEVFEKEHKRKLSQVYEICGNKKN